MYRRVLLLCEKQCSCLAIPEFNNEWKPCEVASIFRVAEIDQLVGVIANGLEKGHGADYQLYGLDMEPWNKSNPEDEAPKTASFSAILGLVWEIQSRKISSVRAKEILGNF